MTSPLAGKPAAPEMLVDLARLERDYYERKPDVGDPEQLVAMILCHGTSQFRVSFGKQKEGDQGG